MMMIKLVEKKDHVQIKQHMESQKSSLSTEKIQNPFIAVFIRQLMICFKINMQIWTLV